jgi:hypothetical protein
MLFGIELRDFLGRRLTLKVSQHNPYDTHRAQAVALNTAFTGAFS